MSVLSQLSSQRGDRSEYSNRKVVIQCLDDPDLLDEIAEGLRGTNAALAGDCAEVMTMVAEDHPEWIAPYAEDLAPLITHKTTRVRWEAVHAVSLIAALVPNTIEPLIPTLAGLICTDSSVIVRDYAVDIIGWYAGTGPSAAEKAFPILKEALTVWDGKQAGHALAGLANVAIQLSALQEELREIAEEYSHHERGVIRKAAQKLRKVVEG
jgi:hypothetical protein